MSLIGLRTLKTLKFVPLYSLVIGQCWIQLVFVFYIIVFFYDTAVYFSYDSNNNMANPHVRTLALKLAEICRW